MREAYRTQGDPALCFGLSWRCPFRTQGNRRKTLERPHAIMAPTRVWPKRNWFEKDRSTVIAVAIPIRKNSRTTSLSPVAAERLHPRQSVPIGRYRGWFEVPIEHSSEHMCATFRGSFQVECLMIRNLCHRRGTWYIAGKRSVYRLLIPAILAFGLGSISLADDVETRVQRVHPKEPSEALATFSVLDGFRMDLIASEPLLRDPVAFTYDENGALYVVEMTDYPKPDNAEETGFGQVRMLLDEDGDGEFDSSHLFAEKLSVASSVICWKGGIFVTAAPDMWYLKDTDGDHQADVREKVLTGFGMTNSEALVNHLKWGVDNKIYGASSNSGGEIRPSDAPAAEALSLRGCDFSFDPTTGQIELLTRANNQWGNGFDDGYNRFVCRNIEPARHIVLPRRYLARNPNLRVEKVYESLAQEGGAEPVFRISPPEPWRVVRARRRQALDKPANPGEINAAGFFTATSGITVYRGNAYPPKYRGNLFIGEPAGNLIHRRTLTPDGVTFDSRRADKQAEIVASRDIFFRPVTFVNAPDGTLHVADMYREVVEGQRWVPHDLQEQGLVDVYGGADRGRIYRLAPPNFEIPRPPRLSGASSGDLVKHLENPNSWWRETAQRLLVERGDKNAIPPLREMSTASKSPLARLHGLWTLEGLRALQDENLLIALTDRSALVREHAIRLAEPRLNRSPELRDRVLALSSDPNARVRFQVAFTLGERTDPLVVEYLTRIAIRDIDDPWIRTALLSSSSQVADRSIEALSANSTFVERDAGMTFLKELAFTVGARGRKDGLKRVIDAIADAPALRSSPRLQCALVVQMAGRSSNDALNQLRNDESSIAGELFSTLLTYARKTAPDLSAAPTTREEAIAFLAFDEFAHLRDILPGLMDASQPREVQLAAIRTLTRFSQPEVASILLDKWAGATPLVKNEIVAAVSGRTEWIGQLLDAVKSGRIPAGQISASRRSALLDHGDSSIRARAVAVLGNDAIGARRDVIAHYEPALKLNGDLERGTAVFLRECGACHRFRDKGHVVGPNLSAYGRHNILPRTLMGNILDPNREVESDFLSYAVVLDDGHIETGMIASETPGSITLRREKNVEATILRKDIELIKSTGKSLMPEGLEKNINVQEMADLLRFLTEINQDI